MKIVIFEDEIYTFHQLRHMLEDMSPEYDVIGPIPSVEQGREYLSLHHDTDIIIADVELNDGLVFDALTYAPRLLQPVVSFEAGKRRIPCRCHAEGRHTDCRKETAGGGKSKNAAQDAAESLP